jgi:hypothetical protein
MDLHKIACRIAGSIKELIFRGISDSDVEYIKDPHSFRSVSLELAEKPYLEGIDPNIVSTSIDPILIQIGHGKLFLVDGRHRWLAARLYGADKIAAKIEELDDQGNVIDEWAGELIIKDKPNESLFQTAEYIRSKED